jgi:hypothetical protein
LQTGYMIIATSNPKNNGINSVFPKKSIAAVKKTICRIFIVEEGTIELNVIN